MRRADALPVDSTFIARVGPLPFQRRGLLKRLSRVTHSGFVPGT